MKIAIGSLEITSNQRDSHFILLYQPADPVFQCENPLSISKEQALGTVIPTPSTRATGLQAIHVHKHGLEGLLLDSIEETLSDILGSRAKEAIFDFLEINCLIGRNEFAGSLGDLFIVLDETFGRGSKTLGKAIAKKLYSKLNWEFFDCPEYDLNDYLVNVKLRLARELTNAFPK